MISRSRMEGRGIGRHTPVGCPSPAKRPSLDEQRAAQLALSSPLGKEDRGREKERRSRGKGGCCRTSRIRAAAGQGSVEGGARADRVESGGRWPLGDRREEMGRWPQPTDGSRCRRSGLAGCGRVGGAGCPSKEKAVLRRRLPCQMVGPRAARAARLRGAGAPDLAGRRGREGTPSPVRRHEHTGA